MSYPTDCLLIIKKNQWKTGYKNEDMLIGKFFFVKVTLSF